MIEIAVINQSTVLTDDQIRPVVDALQIQISRDFAPIWGLNATLSYVGKSTPPGGAWWLVILDNSDQAGALGYHDLTDQGLPLAKVFAKSDMDYGSQWSVTASHELLEMLCDPDINLTMYSDSGLLYAYEVADACEDDVFGYQINGVLVSDFVYPSWFETFRAPGSTQFDFQNKITAPLELLLGGYIGVCNPTDGKGWTQVTANNAQNFAARARVGSRREKRRIPRSHWMVSWQRK